MATSAAKLMKAVWYGTYGGGASAQKHVEAPVPIPIKDEVLIQSGGTVTDIAGEVVEVGPEVAKLKAGDKVVAKLSNVVCFNDVAILCCFFAYCGCWWTSRVAVAKETLTVARPPENSAAALPVACLTAASGGVGHYALQLVIVKKSLVLAD
ncbi:hypothetical protein DCAR_0105175 [Daucus carota subsp. sativus]|uniref:Alcohol dehydrogenase-like N-terminal domain-containing protein n=1 Tax=Daucus carota subsp. sativus TaxID=79200 RepID=A0AAF1AMI8_DAUCS|nr:PREDICTED: putative quinone-oxidoreductase homolog, chloroplastic [Daucus carota subsp. sativus]WOG85982.1 hypothetical protein DCAR_0105175 [Daucus carota subsp. sativus]